MSISHAFKDRDDGLEYTIYLFEYHGEYVIRERNYDDAKKTKTARCSMIETKHRPRITGANRPL
jgi:hypothetical protein